MPVINLYSLSGSPPCRSVLMVLEILGLDVEIKTINTLAGDQFKPEFVEKNPLHTIPLLEDGDFCLPDSHSIMTYLVSKYGAEHRATLYPNDLRIRARVDQMLYFDAATLFSKFRLIMTSIIKENAKEVSADLKVQCNEVYGFLEKFLERSPFLATDHVTLADIAVVATLSTLNLMVPVDEKFVKTHEWFNKLQEYEWYQKGNNEGLAMIGGFLKNVLMN